MNPTIRAYQPADFDRLVILWRVSREVSMPEFQLQKGHFLFEDIAYFRDHILSANQVWVAVDGQDTPLGFMAMRDDFIDQLYIHPDHWRRGIGKTLLAHARSLSPRRVWLYTLQANRNARAFYEKNGFKAIEFGVSPPPENEPDVKYAWEPD